MTGLGQGIWTFKELKFPNKAEFPATPSSTSEEQQQTAELFPWIPCNFTSLKLERSIWVRACNSGMFWCLTPRHASSRDAASPPPARSHRGLLVTGANAVTSARWVTANRVTNDLAACQSCLFGAIVFISHISQYIWSENMHKHDWNLLVLPQRTNCSETVKLCQRKTVSRSSKRGCRDSTAPSSQPQALAVLEQTSHGHKSSQKESF